MDNLSFQKPSALSDEQSKALEFSYLGQSFRPLNRFVGISESFDSVSRKLKIIGIGNYQPEESTLPFSLSTYSYDDFYEAAKKAGCYGYDAYLMNEKTVVIPCSYQLMEYRY